MQKSKVKLFATFLFAFILSGCAEISEVKAEFPPSRIDIYIIDVSKSIVSDEINSSKTLFNRVEDRIRKDIANNAIGSPEVYLGGKNIDGKPALGLYIQLMGDRASEYGPELIRSPQTSQELWSAVEQMNLNEVNTFDLWSKIQEVSSQINSDSSLTMCKDIVMENLVGQSGDKSQQENISNVLCDVTIGSNNKLDNFKKELEDFLQTPFRNTGSPGTPGSDIFGTVKNVQSWIKTISESSNIKPTFNVVLISDMVHDADSDQNLNKILPKLNTDEIRKKAIEDSSTLNLDFSNLQTNVFIVGLGAFGDSYEGKADFSSKLQDYWDAYFNNISVKVNFTSSLDDVRLT